MIVQEEKEEKVDISGENDSKNSFVDIGFFRKSKYFWIFYYFFLFRYFLLFPRTIFL